jgi:CHAT domain-containing protein
MSDVKNKCYCCISPDAFGGGTQGSRINFEKFLAVVFCGLFYFNYQPFMKQSFLNYSTALCLVLLFIQVSTTSAQEATNPADTLRARQLLAEAKDMGKKGQLDEALLKAEEAKNIYVRFEGSSANIGATDAWYRMGVIYFRKQKAREALAAFSKSLELGQQEPGYSKTYIAHTYFNMAQLLQGLEEYSEALAHYETAKRILRENGMTQSREMSNLYTNLGRLYFNMGMNREAIAHLQQSSEILQGLRENTGAAMNAVLVNLGNCFSMLRDYEKALQLQEEALKITLNLNGDKGEAYSTILNNIGICNQGLKEYEKSIQYHKMAIKNREAIPNNAYNQIQSYVNISNAYKAINQPDTAMWYMQKANRLVLTDSTLPAAIKASVFTNIGSCYILIKKLDAAKEYTGKSIATKQQLYGPNHPDLVLATLNLGDIYVDLLLFDSAKIFYLEALRILGYNGKASSGSTEYLPLLSNALSKLGYWGIFFYNTKPSLEYIHQAHTFFQQSIATFDKISRTLSPASKSSLAAESAEVFIGAIATNQLLHAHTDSLHYWQESFDYAERSKAYLLYEAMKDADALHIAGIPDSLLEQEYQLRVEITHHDKRKQEKLNSGLSETDTIVLAIGSRIFDLKQRHESLIKLFETKYPDYYQAKYGLKTTSLTEVQKSLLPSQTMLQYVLGDSSIFLFLVQKNHFEVQEIKKDFPLEQWVDTLTRLGIYGYHTLPLSQKTPEIETGTVNNYTYAAQRLYEKLIAPVKSKLSPEVIIIPDGVLGYVPFEALLPKTPGKKGIFTSYPFLLNEHRISYCYSATLLREMRNKKHRNPASKSVLALAPFFRDDLETLNARLDSTDFLSLRDSLKALKASGEEVARIAKLWKGTPIVGADASLDTFHQLAAMHRILHLSTHGKADDRVGDYAYLALGTSDDQKSFEKLYARDLYNLELNADLVVLSACETGIGKLRRGEGIVSLARAFAYAGAKSLVTSLWKVDDFKTKDLLVDFYRHLKSGKSKDAALQQAKLDFLNKNRSDGGEFMHPFFWAGFIAIGDMGAMK